MPFIKFEFIHHCSNDQFEKLHNIFKTTEGVVHYDGLSNIDQQFINEIVDQGLVKNNNTHYSYTKIGKDAMKVFYEFVEKEKRENPEGLRAFHFKRIGL